MAAWVSPAPTACCVARKRKSPGSGFVGDFCGAQGGLCAGISRKRVWEGPPPAPKASQACCPVCWGGRCGRGERGKLRARQEVGACAGSLPLHFQFSSSASPISQNRAGCASLCEPSEGGGEQSWASDAFSACRGPLSAPSTRRVACFLSRSKLATCQKQKQPVCACQGLSEADRGQNADFLG